MTSAVIKRAKGQYRNKVELYYTGSATRRMWQGLHPLRMTKDPAVICPDTSLPDKLNGFYERFDHDILPSVRAVTDPEDWVISL